MGGPGKLCEALTWWGQGWLCCALPPADEAALRSHLSGVASQLCTRMPLPSVGSQH